MRHALGLVPGAFAFATWGWGNGKLDFFQSILNTLLRVAGRKERPHTYYPHTHQHVQGVHC